MSQYPYQDPNQYQNPNPYQDPYNSQIPYASPGMYAPPKRPGAITVLAILGIIFGSLGLLGGCFNLATSMMSNGGRNSTMPGGPVLDPGVVQYGMVENVVGMIMAGVLLGGCIFALKLSPAARTTMLVWSLISIVRDVVGTILAIVWVLPATEAFMRSMGGRQGNAMAGMITSFGTVMVIVAALFGLVMPILFLTLWNKENVKAAFAGTKQYPQSWPPPGGQQGGQQW